jgi:hypothetical protein
MRTKTDNRNGNAGRLFAPVILFGIFAAITSMASDAKLAWDASPTTGVSNYVLYASTNILSATNMTSATVRLNVGTNLTATVERIQAGQWFFAATAMKDGLESEPSNILIVDVPTPPARMRTVVVQYSGTLTNFYDVGFFRLRLP